MGALLNLDDVLALLEEQPLDSAALAAFLELPVDLVHRSLCAAERVHTVKRVGTRQLWARPDYVAPVGRRPKVSLDACRAAILDAVSRGPKPMQLLIAETGYPRNTLKHQCEQLRQAGAIRLAGTSRGAFWVTPSWQPPASGSSTASEARTPEVRVEDLEPVDDGEPVEDVDDIEADLPAAPQTRERLPRAGLRQPHERPAKVSLKIDGALPWWATSPRDGFTAAAEGQRGRMMAAKESRFVQPRLLQ